MNQKRPFLLSRARHLAHLVDLSAYYDDWEQLNLSSIGGEVRPVVLNASAAWTCSKTESAPGDDDPDPEAEGCY